jgi:hypothetical protein
MPRHEPANALSVSELTTAELQQDRSALIDLSRAAASSGLAPGFARDGPDAWLEWHWDAVIEQQKRMDVRVFAAHAADRLVGALLLRSLRAPGWGGWEPWKRLRVDNVIVSPNSPAEIEDALLDFALTRSLADLVVVETLPGGRVQHAAERLGFVAAARIADLLVGPDGSPAEAVVLTRSHAKPSVIGSELLAQVGAVTPSGGRRLLYRPCEVVLKDGRVVDRVYVQEAWTWKQTWGVWPEDDRGKSSIAIDDVASIRESPSRIDPRLATRLLDAGESGMGYSRFTLVLRDGRRINTMTGGAVDFPGLPDGVAASDVVDVIPHEHVGMLDTKLPDPPYWWCLYTLPAKADQAGSGPGDLRLV